MMKSSKDLSSARLERWKVYILDFDLTTIKHRSKKITNVDDLLARYPIPEKIVKAMVIDVLPYSIHNVHLWNFQDRRAIPSCALDLHRISTRSAQDARREQEKDPVGNALIARLLHQPPSPAGLDAEKRWGSWLNKYAHQFTIYDGVLSFQSHDDASCRPYVPAAERDRLLRFVHAHPLGGHFGKDKTYAKLRRSFFWPNMQKESNNFVDACQECALKRGHGRRITPPLKPIPPPSSAMDKVAMDILKLPKTSDNNEYALVITCLLTGYINIKAMPNQKAETVVQAFLESVLPHGGIPLRVLTDQGRQFTGNLMTALAERLHFEQLFTSAFHPKSDGISERNNATLIQMASKFLKGRQDDWDRLLPLMTYAYNSATSSRTGTSPFFLMFGREPRPIHDGSLMTHQLNPAEDFNAFFADLPMRLRLAWKLAEDTSIAQKEKDKRAYDKKTKPVPFQVGDWVLVYQPALKNSKLASPYEGPGKIIRLYPEDAPTNADVQIPGKRKVRKCNVDRLSAAREALIPKDDPPPPDSLIPLPPRGRGRPARFRPSTPPPPASTHPADPNLELEASSDDGAAGVVYTAEYRGCL